MVGLKDDRLAIRRHLDGTATDAQRPLPAWHLQRLPFQAGAHTIRVGAELPDLGEEGLQLILLEAGGIAAGDHPQQRLGLVIRLKGPGHTDPSQEAGRPTGQPIPRLQWPAGPIHTAQSLAHLTADAAQHRLAGKAPGHRQIQALATAGKTQAQHLATTQRQARPQRHGLLIDRQRHVGPAEGHPGIQFGLQLHITQGNFQQRRAPGVIQQAIGPGGGLQIHHPGGGHPQVLPAIAPSILQQALRARLEHAQAFHGWPPSALKVASSIGRNRTRSP